MPANMASSENVAKINQRFRDLEVEIRELRQNQKVLENAIGNFHALIQGQNETIAKVFALAYRTGERED